MNFFSRLSIVQKVLLILCIPLCLSAFSMGREITEQKLRLQEAIELKALTSLCSRLGKLASDIQNERFYSLNSLVADQTTPTYLSSLRADIDSIFLLIEEDKREFETAHSQHIKEFRELFQPVDVLLSQLSQIRSRVDQTDISKEAVKEYYCNLNEGIINCMQTIPRWAAFGEMSARLIACAHLVTVTEEIELMRALVKFIFQEKSCSLKQYAELVSRNSSMIQHLDIFSDLSATEVVYQYREKAQAPSSKASGQIIASLLEAGPALQVDLKLTEQEWIQTSSAATESLQLLAQTICESINQTSALYEKKIEKQFLINISTLTFVFLIVTILAISFIYNLRHQFSILIKGLEVISKGDLTKSIQLKGNNELVALAQFINERFTINLRQINLQIQQIAAVLKNVAQELSESSQKTLATSNQQSYSVKEVVSTMEDTNQLSSQIATKMSSVEVTVAESKTQVSMGFNIIQDNQLAMSEIKAGNNHTIEGIKLLEQQISSIWDIVNMINNIADQTKIIAFNAELEASSAGEAGKNFQIVATEIRRLADNTVISTGEIKNKIYEIQKSSDRLVITAGAGSQKIEAGWNLSQELQNIFNTISSGSETTVGASKEVSVSVQQQVNAFGQILTAMKQISAGISNFTTAVGDATKMAENLQNLAVELDKIVKQYKLGDN